MTFFETLEQDLNLFFGNDQQDAIRHFEGPALTLAIPGSGKTTLMLARAVYLSEVHGLDPRNLLNLTFSKAAASDMAERYTTRFRPHFRQQFEFSTIHSFAYRVLGQVWKERGVRPRKLITHTRELLSAAAYHVSAARPNDDQYETLSNQIGYARNMMFAAGQLSASGLDYPEIDRISEAYEALKAKHHVMDFDDLLLAALKLLQEDAGILNRLKKRYPFVQIDEAQDTSKVQHEILKRLVYPSNNLFIVADDDQAIYGFRGASPELLMSFESQFPRGQIYHLSKNYRSRQEIIKVCADIICHNQTRYDKVLKASRDKGGKVSLLEFENYADRNAAILEHLQSTQGQSTGILFRNHLSGLSVMDTLLEAGLPFKVEAGRRTLSDHWLVRDLAAFLQLSEDPSNLEAFQRIVHKTELRIKKEILETIKLNHRGRDVFEVCLETIGRKGHYSDRIRGVQQAVGKLRRLRAVDFLETVDGELGYSGYLEFAQDNLGQSADKIRSLWFSLIAIASRFRRPEQFFERLAALDQYKPSGQDANIALSTLHASKGREFDHVILIDTLKGIFPVKEEARTEAQRLLLEEERRLFYVGVSRARESVNLMHARFGGGRHLRLSLFVTEIMESLERVRPKRPEAKPGDSLMALPDAVHITGTAHHLRFGRGEVLSLNGDAIEIMFNDKARTLSLRLCLEKGFLTFPAQ
ncbi:ATP-dependent helicase [Acidaminobacter hydrogenoformans]|uniref:DNA 3'-5' helicase n=1 Tax=Acidaminobacter hydrogenoformans DSM 2784 TaxID=1120920 RepID=A0A1G5RXP5_9FIRM|nr:ATP-dependent helicase [Acidaminobacter hydrogenoformans]SCZ78905.1 DNA helicase-2 / ATP-dependent DNA helicase PcrA [Acidaminobacter hydrogenoformans DSM 2784]